METVRDFIFLGSKIIADGDCSHEIKRHLLLGGKAVTNLCIILKSRDITLPTNDHLFQAIVFPVVKYGCECWTIKKVEHQKIDAFDPWFWRRLLRVLWTARRSNQSILKEISPEYSKEWCWSWNSNTWPPDAKNWLRKDPDAGKDWSQEEKRMTEWKGWIASPIRWIWVWVCSGSWWWIGKPAVLQSMESQRIEPYWVTELNWND